MSNKKVSKKKVVNLALLAMFSAIIVAMTFTPYIGYITIPGMLSITTVHIMVIIAAISMGTYSAGLIVGTVWGVSCLLYAMYNGTADAAIFLDPRISVVPRMLVGLAVVAFYKLALLANKKSIYTIILKCFTIVLIDVLAGLLCYNISKNYIVVSIVCVAVLALFVFLFFFFDKTKDASAILFAAICGTFSNTVLVLFAINLFGSNGLIDLTGTIKGIFSTVIALNGSIEITAAALVAIPCCVAVQNYMKKL